MMYAEDERFAEKIRERAIRDEHRAAAFALAGVEPSQELSDFFGDGDFSLSNALSLIEQAKGFSVEIDAAFLTSVAAQLSGLSLEGLKAGAALAQKLEHNTFADRKDEHFGYEFVNSFQAFAG
jgi:hypothetical protein